MDLEHFRLVNVCVSFLIASTLSWRHFYYRSARGFDNRMRSLSSVGVFGISAVISGVYFQRHVPTSGLLVVLTGFLSWYLIALWTPWRWHVPPRKPRPFDDRTDRS